MAYTPSEKYRQFGNWLATQGWSWDDIRRELEDWEKYQRIAPTLPGVGRPTPAWVRKLEKLYSDWGKLASPDSAPAVVHQDTFDPGSSVPSNLYPGQNHATGTWSVTNYNPPTRKPAVSTRGYGTQGGTEGGGLLDKPGIGETTATDVLAKLPGTGNNLSNFWSTQGSKALNPPTPKNASTQWGKGASDWFGAPTSPGAANAYGISKTLANPTQSEINLNNLGNTLGTPTEVENYTRNAAPYFSTRSGGERGAQGALDTLSSTGAMENSFPGIMDAISRINYGQQAIGDVRGALSGSYNAQQFLDRSRGLQTFQTTDENGRPITKTIQKGPNWFDQNIALDEYGKYFAPLTRNQSYSEQLFSGGEGQRAIDTYYDRNQQKAERDLNRQLAARGIFNSGRALRANEELGADVTAAKAAQLQSLAGQADKSMLDRVAAAQGFMGTAAQEALGRKGIEVSASTAADTAATNRAGRLTDVFGMASTEALGKTKQQTDTASAAQAARDRRLEGLVAGNLDLSRTEQNRIEGGGRMAALGTEGFLKRTGAAADIFGKQGDLGLRRSEVSANTGVAADDATTRRLAAGMQISLGMDENEFRGFTAYLQGLGISVQALSAMDQNDIRKLVTQYEIASGTQGLYQGRLLTGLGVERDVANTLFGATTGETGKAIEEALGIGLKDIEAIIGQGGAAAQQMINKVNLATSLIKAGVDVAMIKKLLAADPAAAGTAGTAGTTAPTTYSTPVVQV